MRKEECSLLDMMIEDVRDGRGVYASFRWWLCMCLLLIIREMSFVVNIKSSCQNYCSERT